jgi:integrase/recombinase XerD
MTDETISPLRRRMIEDMTIRQLGAKTQSGYIRAVKKFLGHSPDRATIDDIRRYQLRLASSGLGVPSVNAAMTALRFFFKVTLRRGDVTEDIVFAREPRRLPVVLSPDEVARLLAAAAGVKYKAVLSIAYGTGLRASEVISLKVGDIDSARMLIRVDQGKACPCEGGGPQGPIRDVVAAAARPVAAVVADRKAAVLAVSRPGARRAPHHAATQPGCPCSGATGGDR